VFRLLSAFGGRLGGRFVETGAGEGGTGAGCAIGAGKVDTGETGRVVTAETAETEEAVAGVTEEADTGEAGAVVTRGKATVAGAGSGAGGVMLDRPGVDEFEGEGAITRPPGVAVAEWTASDRAPWCAVCVEAR
jgi:hypothetical protein